MKKYSIILACFYLLTACGNKEAGKREEAKTFEDKIQTINPLMEAPVK